MLAGYVLLANGFGEEVGWRGFLAHRLLPRLGRLRTATLVWALWAFWHAPVFLVVENFRDFGPATATEATAGVVAATTSTLVIVAAFLVLLRSAPFGRGPAPS